MLAVGGYAPAGGGLARATGRRGRGRVDPYPLVVRPLVASTGRSLRWSICGTIAHALRLGDRRDAVGGRDRLSRTFVADGDGHAETELIERRSSRSTPTGAPTSDSCGGSSTALDAGRPVAFYGWWPTAVGWPTTTEILGVDAMEVRRRTASGPVWPTATPS